jgi:VWFA-related protein
VAGSFQSSIVNAPIPQSIINDAINKSSILLVTLIAALGVAAASVSGQQDVFRGGVELVEVTVSVTDANGQAVKDLTVDDFEVRESDRPQPIALFDRIEIPLPSPVPEDAPPMPMVAGDVASNAFPENGRAFVLVLDDLPVEASRTPTLRRLARQFVERHAGPDDLLLVLATSGRTDPTQEFTTDKARVLQAIDSVIGFQYELPPTPPGWTPILPVPCEKEYESVTMLDTMKALATHLASIKRRRTTVVFMGAGYTPNPVEDKCPDLVQPSEKAIEALQRSNVTLYAISPFQNADTPSDGSRLLAESTGGFAGFNPYPWTGLEFGRIIQESSHYYLLGYYPSERRSEGQFRSIAVRVRRPGLKVSNRPGYVYRMPRPPANASRPVSRRPTPAPLASLLDHPLPTPGLPMRVQAIPLRQSDTRARVQLIVEVSGQDLSFEARDGRFVERIEFATVAFDSKGQRGVEHTTAANLRLTSAERDRAVRTGIRWVSVLELPQGRHDVRVAGHAVTSDRRGSVFIDVDVPRFDREMTTSGLAVTSLTAASTFTTGGPVLLPPLPSPPTVQRTFPLGDVLAVSAEIYRPSERTMLFRRRPAEAPSEFLVRITKAAPPQTVVVDQPLPVLSDRHATPYVSFAINTKHIGPGRFVLRLVRRSGDQPADDVPGAVPFEVVAR